MPDETHDTELEISPGACVEHSEDAEDRGVASIWWKLTTKADYIDFLNEHANCNNSARSEVESIPVDTFMQFYSHQPIDIFQPGLWRRQKPYLNRCRLEILTLNCVTGMSVRECLAIWSQNVSLWQDQWSVSDRLNRWVSLDDETLFRQSKFKTLIQSLRN